MPEIRTPPLAVYKSITDYVPTYADFVIWSGWFRTWYGVVVDYDSEKQQLVVAFENTPRLLFTMHEDEIRDNLVMLSLPDIRKRKRGRWYVQKSSNGQNVWYI